MSGPHSASSLLLSLWLGASASAATLALDAPLERQVVQRDSRMHGSIAVAGTVVGGDGRPDAVEARLSVGSVTGAWQRLPARIDGHSFRASLRAPAGGWHRLEVRALTANVTLAEARVERVGVGEIFVVAGQSNAANHGAERQRATSDLVATFDGTSWRPAHDPQPGASGEGGSFMPPFADAVATHFRVPVGIIACGVGASSVREWLPEGSRFPTPPTLTHNVAQLDEGGWASKGTLYSRLISRVSPVGAGGFRAVLWHQGESDANQADATRTLDGALYASYLEQLIRDSRRDIGWSAPWFVALATYHAPGDEASPDIREAQRSTWRDGLALEGPDTDALGSELRDNDGQGVHFSGAGLREHAARWAAKIVPWLERELSPEGGAALPTNGAPARQIRFAHTDAAEAKRRELVEFIWGGALPTDRLPTVTESIPASIFSGDLEGIDASRVARVDKLVATVHGLDSVAYMLHPVRAAAPGRLVVIHQGHAPAGQGLSGGVGACLDELLDRGFVAVAMQMPLYGWNGDRDVVLAATDASPGRAIPIARHDDLFDRLPPPLVREGEPFRFFLEPVTLAINHWLATTDGAGDISVIGLSGGGWTTHMIAAVDPRVRLSIPVAGATTLAARNADRGSVGDKEQYFRPLYREDVGADGHGGGVATWLEIFVLGGHGERRRQIMVTAEFDSCCFSGRHADAYKDVVAELVGETLGEGSWEHRLDSSHRGHEISPWVIDTVIVPALEPTPGR